MAADVTANGLAARAAVDTAAATTSSAVDALPRWTLKITRGSGRGEASAAVEPEETSGAGGGVMPATHATDKAARTSMDERGGTAEDKAMGRPRGPSPLRMRPVHVRATREQQRRCE